MVVVVGVVVVVVVVVVVEVGALPSLGLTLSRLCSPRCLTQPRSTSRPMTVGKSGVSIRVVFMEDVSRLAQ